MHTNEYRDKKNLACNFTHSKYAHNHDDHAIQAHKRYRNVKSMLELEILTVR